MQGDHELASDRFAGTPLPTWEAWSVGAGRKRDFLHRAGLAAVCCVGLAALLPSCSSPAPGSKAALATHAIDAQGLGTGWSTRWSTTYVSNGKLIPCAGDCGPIPRGNSLNLWFINQTTNAQFFESVIWTSQPARLVATIQRSFQGARQTPPTQGGIALFTPPRIGSYDQADSASVGDGNYYLIYYVEVNGYVGDFEYSGPSPSTVEIRTALASFA